MVYNSLLVVLRTVCSAIGSNVSMYNMQKFVLCTTPEDQQPRRVESSVGEEADQGLGASSSRGGARGRRTASGAEEGARKSGGAEGPREAPAAGGVVARPLVLCLNVKGEEELFLDALMADGVPPNRLPEVGVRTLLLFLMMG